MRSAEEMDQVQNSVSLLLIVTCCSVHYIWWPDLVPFTHIGCPFILLDSVQRTLYVVRFCLELSFPSGWCWAEGDDFEGWANELKMIFWKIQVWSFAARSKIDLLVPKTSEIGRGRLTVGEIKRKTFPIRFSMFSSSVPSHWFHQHKIISYISL